MNRKILITGAAGKVGQNFINHIKNNRKFNADKIIALCHNRMVKEDDQINCVKGDISVETDVSNAMKGVTHVIHLATCKEVPKDVMDITVKGLFWLLEECRKSPTFQQFILLGGDAGIGHCVYPNDKPLTEEYPHRAYPGCYALSKVLEEVMLNQYYIQYNLNGCCLRAPWIMEKDDFKMSLSFGDDAFGGPSWKDAVGAEKAVQYKKDKIIPVMLDEKGEPIKRNFVHVKDLVSAMGIAIDHPKAKQELFNICMNEPMDYKKMGEYLQESRGFDFLEIKMPCFSNWLDNSKAKFLLGWSPEYDLKKLVDDSFDYVRNESEERVVFYPG
ncbi:MAG: UDP-glucose 4-epimerase [Planctomycetota bacterium]|nr:MAG: UDP-glucose 4-epimerase [Planctomycetota bacterium]